MSEYVRITSSPSEIMAVAASISSRGEQLEHAVSGLNDAIRQHEDPGKVFPSDQFTDPFKANYEQSVTGADGHATTANEAVRSSAEYCGKKLQEIGDFVAQAMMNYGATDDDGAADITSVQP